jgi:hypothetical protein
VHQPGTIAKVMLVLFAVLFTAVLIHPDVDLLDVHDVKLVNAQNQFRSTEGQLLQQAPILFAKLQLPQSTVLERLFFVEQSITSFGIAASSTLRV